MQILFLGAPGAGKGTQCKKLSAKLNLPHLSSGDLLREAVAQGTAAGITAKGFMDKGVLVPDEVLIDMFRDKLSSPACAGGFILDGFPRNVAQAKSLDNLLHDIKKDLTCVINLQTDDSLLTERITGRRSCKKCGAVYHVKFQPPKNDNLCDACGTELTQRSDDKEELVKERLRTYREQTAPLIEYYGGKNLLSTISGEGDPDKIFENIEQTLKSCQRK
ncbi:MAG TPA: adenylate kinase [Chroococcales cyanobacterium]